MTSEFEDDERMNLTMCSLLVSEEIETREEVTIVSGQVISAEQKL